MARFCGIVGYAETKETRPLIWEDRIIERKYYGDVVKNKKRTENSGNVNDDIVLSNAISIIADAYAYDHFFAIKYVIWQNSKWKVTEVEVSRPRLILTLGGIYNGPTPEDSAEDLE